MGLNLVVKSVVIVGFFLQYIKTVGDLCFKNNYSNKTCIFIAYISI